MDDEFPVSVMSLMLVHAYHDEELVVIKHVVLLSMNASRAPGRVINLVGLGAGRHR
jgi:hypothetical protein